MSHTSRAYCIYAVLLAYSIKITAAAPSIAPSAVAPNTVVATVPVGVTPAGLAITPDGKFAYVANNNNYPVTGQNSVSVIDLSTNLVKTTIHDASFDQPYTVTINADGTKAYVTNSNGTTITIIDIATNTVTGTIGGFDGPSGMVITPDGTTAYVNEYGSGHPLSSGNAYTVRVVDLNTNTIVGPAIIVGSILPPAAPAALAITPDGAHVYVINYQDGNPGTGTMSIIDTSTNIATLDVVTGLSGPFAIAITPDGTRAYVTNFGSNNFSPIGTTVSAINLSNNTIIATINLGIQPSGLAITPDGRYAYVSNYNTLYMNPAPSFTGLTAGEGTVNIIDIKTNTVLPPTIVVGESPDAIAISPDGAFAYVSNYTADTVTVIALPTFNLTARGCRIVNQFLLQADVINKITWQVDGTAQPTSYKIYRDAQLTDLAATVPASGPLLFLDHNRNPRIKYTYYIVATFAYGSDAAPVAITITKNC